LTKSVQGKICLDTFKKHSNKYITSRDRQKLNSGVRVRCVVKSTELVKFKLAALKKSRVGIVQVGNFFTIES